MNNFVIENVKSRVEQSTASFETPKKNEINKIKIGDIVKVIITPNDTNKSERMWVRINRIEKKWENFFYRRSR